MNDNTPDLTAERLRLAAAAALNEAGFSAVTLFTPTLEARLRIEPATGAVVALDEDGEPRRGVTAAMVARELRAEYEKRDRRFFR
jgi:hypothetical protein